MAITSRIDELNVLGSTPYLQKIKKYFEEMELPEDEITERVELANNVFTMFNAMFIMMIATQTVDETIDYSYYKDFVDRRLRNAVESRGIEVDNYIEDYLVEMTTEIMRTTEENISKSDTLAPDRAVIIAETTTNTIANYEREKKAIEQGKTMKRWVALVDKKTRKTHIHADGQEVKIGTPFKVGGFKMMFPLDGSLCDYGNPQECINCRCKADYF